MTDQEFSYEVFDRQVQALINQGMLLVKGYDDMTTMELNLDLKSFYIKASKVCVMADIDFRLQHENFCRERAQQNIDLRNAMTLFVIGIFSPFINRIVARYQSDGRFEGVKAELFPYSISEVMPWFKEIPDINFDGIDTTIEATRVIEKEMKKRGTVKFPGITHMERMWMLFEIYALLCYLLRHFIRMDELTHEKLDPDEERQMFLAHLKRIDMRQLRERIKRMLPLVKRKNHWFCVWSVLRFRNLLATERFETFAQQMMSPEWFGSEPRVKPFSGDTLNEYSGYFTDCPYTRWNEKDYRLYLATHCKKKWGKTLCEHFSRLCLEMNEAFCTDPEE